MGHEARRWRVVVPVAWAAAHAGLSVATALGLLGSGGTWAWRPMFVIDFPFSILLLPLLNAADPLVVFAVLGSAWWFVLGKSVVAILQRFTEYEG